MDRIANAIILLAVAVMLHGCLTSDRTVTAVVIPVQEVE